MLLPLRYLCDYLSTEEKKKESAGAGARREARGESRGLKGDDNVYILSLAGTLYNAEGRQRIIFYRWREYYIAQKETIERIFARIDSL